MLDSKVADCVSSLRRKATMSTITKVEVKSKNNNREDELKEQKTTVEYTFDSVNKGMIIIYEGFISESGVETPYVKHCQDKGLYSAK
jgi:hypothetical protein